jgi:serine/threonine protein kinase
MCTGGALDKALQKDGKDVTCFSCQQRLQMAVAICRALAHLHTVHQQVHRDVKTPNVLLLASPFQQHGEISMKLNANMLRLTKVADFGTVREDVRHRKDAVETTATNNQKSHATTSNIIGTLAYMAPEYIAYGHVSVKTDTFAFGVVLMELMTNMSGHKSRSVMDLELAEINASSLQSLPQVQSKGWSDKQLDVLGDIVERCMLMKPMKRCALKDVVPELEVLLE